MEPLPLFLVAMCFPFCPPSSFAGCYGQLRNRLPFLRTELLRTRCARLRSQFTALLQAELVHARPPAQRAQRLGVYIQLLPFFHENRPARVFTLIPSYQADGK